MTGPPRALEPFFRVSSPIKYPRWWVKFRLKDAPTWIPEGQPLTKSVCLMPFPAPVVQRLGKLSRGTDPVCPLHLEFGLTPTVMLAFSSIVMRETSDLAFANASIHVGSVACVSAVRKVSAQPHLEGESGLSYVRGRRAAIDYRKRCRQSHPGELGEEEV